MANPTMPAADPPTELLRRLQNALRNAHAAGDTVAARKLTAEIRRRSSAAAQAPAAEPMDVAPGAFASTGSGPFGTGPMAPPEPAEPTARERGQESAHTRGGPVPAFLQGVGSMTFGVGTPATAAGEFLSAALPGGDPAMSPGEAMEFARGRREELEELHPNANLGGLAAGLVTGAGAARTLLNSAPKIVQTVFTPAAKQTKRNIGRLMAGGGTAAGVTAANEQGAEAVPMATGVGMAAGPIGAGALALGRGIASGIHSKINPDNAAVRLLAKRLGELPAALAQRYDDFVATMGRPPRLVEILRQETAEELAQVGRVRTDAGRVLRDAAEEATEARPVELPPLVRGGEPVSSIPAADDALRTVRDEAGDLVRSRAKPERTAADQLTIRDQRMSRVMGTIGGHRVPMTQDMLEVIQHPDVWNSLDAALRRRIGGAIEQGEQIGSIDLSVSAWDAIRQELAAKSGPGAGLIYARLRDKIRDYVSSVVPEYGSALRDYGRRSGRARGTEAGRRALTQAGSEFAAALRNAGDGVVEQAGMRVGARIALADALSGAPDKADRYMKRLAQDKELQANLREVLSPAELRELGDIAKKYGYVLDFREGVKAGGRILGAKREAFNEATAQAAAGSPQRRGIEQGARGALTDAAGEDPVSAVKTAARLAQSPGLRSRLAFALGQPETDRLRKVGSTALTATRNLAAATPSGTYASSRAAEQAQEIQKIIGFGIVVGGKGSGAMQANVLNYMIQHVSLSKKAATRLAEMAVDPAEAPKVIARLRSLGLDPERIVRMYRDAALASGILVGQD